MKIQGTEQRDWAGNKGRRKELGVQLSWQCLLTTHKAWDSVLASHKQGIQGMAVPIPSQRLESRSMRIRSYIESLRLT